MGEYLRSWGIGSSHKNHGTINFSHKNHGTINSITIVGTMNDSPGQGISICFPLVSASSNEGSSGVYLG